MLESAKFGSDAKMSGSVDVKELRDIITAMYPLASVSLTRAAMAKARTYTDADGELDVASFQDAIAVVME